MKMNKEHYEILKKHVLGAIPKIPSIDVYHDNGLSDKRYRWDLLWKSGLKIGDGKGMTVGLPLYSYINADHIDTALRHILRNRDMEEDNSFINDIRVRAGLPIVEDTGASGVLRALRGAHMSLNQVKSDLEDNMLVNRMGMSNGEYASSTINDQLAAISECVNMYENASGSASGAGSIASGAGAGNPKNNSAYADKVRKNKKAGKKTETIFALSDS